MKKQILLVAVSVLALTTTANANWGSDNQNWGSNNQNQREVFNNNEVADAIDRQTEQMRRDADDERYYRRPLSKHERTEKVKREMGL